MAKKLTCNPLIQLSEAPQLQKSKLIYADDFLSNKPSSNAYVHVKIRNILGDEILIFNFNKKFNFQHKENATNYTLNKKVTAFKKTAKASYRIIRISCANDNEKFQLTKWINQLRLNASFSKHQDFVWLYSITQLTPLIFLLQLLSLYHQKSSQQETRRMRNELYQMEGQ